VQGLYQVSALLLFILHRIAFRLHVFYADLATHSITDFETEKKPRALWKLVSRRIKDRSFFILSQEMLFSKMQPPPTVKTGSQSDHGPNRKLSTHQANPKRVLPPEDSRVNEREKSARKYTLAVGLTNVFSKPKEQCMTRHIIC
jgi:hypothetical protein